MAKLCVLRLGHRMGRDQRITTHVFLVARAMGAAEGVLKNRLLDVDFEGAGGALVHISGGADLTLGDAIKAGEIVTEKMDPEANVKWGARLIPGYDGKIEIVAIVTGVKGASILGKPMDEGAKEATAIEEIELL